MTFTWLNKQGVESDSGFVLQRMHRFFYHYIEADHVIQVKVEPDIKGERILLSSLSKWQPPHEGDVITDAARVKIRADIVTALGFMKIKHKFV